MSFLFLLKPVLPVFEYVWNYEYITTELCENKDQPIMGCNGKCYLMKELAKASETEKPQSSDKKHPISETADLFLQDFNTYEMPLVPAPSEKNNPTAYANLYAHLQAQTFFHPPTFVS